MSVATVMTRVSERIITPRQSLWINFFSALSQRNYVRALALADRLNLEEERIAAIKRDAIKQFIAEYQNFDAATRLCADYCLTVEEMAELVAEILKDQELETMHSFTVQIGKPAHLSIAEQIRVFARQYNANVNRRKRSLKLREWWKIITERVRAWFDRFMRPWHGGFPKGSFMSKVPS